MNQANSNPEQIRPRKAHAVDANSIARFNINMAMETEGYTLNSDTILAGVTSLIRHPERGFYLVIDEPLSASIGDRITDKNAEAVVASLMITTEWSDWRNSCFWWIQSVYVLPEWRRKGLYSQLYAEVKRLAIEAESICGFRLYVEKNNAVAQQTYNALGMDETHYLMFEEAIPPAFPGGPLNNDNGEPT